jgi:hypothetical protein
MASAFDPTTPIGSLEQVAEPQFLVGYHEGRLVLVPQDYTKPAPKPEPGPITKKAATKKAAAKKKYES